VHAVRRLTDKCEIALVPGFVLVGETADHAAEIAGLGYEAHVETLAGERLHVGSAGAVVDRCETQPA